ncbi:sensor histidine kinase [Mucilaginibacter jinjuensis]|uniref:Histidine kinase n=1 Tax=Mucilaginibacter jinjuensis TaxID=1176721 RepID=A0ABY7T6H2_9SPHI|nr:histidine kinase [Mucilaginibacter jinjuensis]WCT12080.1 histidine kinase [Mucilaginibacter jinjuensis]
MGTGVGKLKNGRGVYSRTKIIYAHIIVWAIFIAYELSALYYIIPHFTSPLDIAIHYLLNIGLFYCNSLFLFPKAYKSKSILQLPLLAGIILEIVLYLVLLYSLDHFLALLKISTLPVRSTNSFIVTSTYRAFYMILISTGYWLGGYLLKSRIEIDVLIQKQLEDKNEQLELQKKIIVSENAFLKAQINPHFLFNSLNFVYNTIHKVSASAAEAVMLLSDITRYSLRKSDANGQMPIHEEIEQISNLIELNQLRFNGELQIKFELGLITPSFTIPPLLLVSFVENIFKYGKLNDPETPAVVSIKEADGVLQFRSKNVIQKRKGTEGYGVGLENTKLRLNNIFADRHRLDIATTENIYTVELDIQMSPC